MNVEQAIAEVKSKARGRTRYEGQKPYIDELLVARIEELKAERDDWEAMFRHEAAKRHKAEHEAAAMREALEGLLPIAAGDEPCFGEKFELTIDMAVQALTTQAGQLVADVVKAADAWERQEPDMRWQFRSKLREAVLVYRAALHGKADR